MLPWQLSFDLNEKSRVSFSSSVTAAIESLAEGYGAESRGAIFTRVEVVDFILDLVGYTNDRPLHKMRLLEPSFGNGGFLLPIIERLLTAWRVTMGIESAFEDLGSAIRAVELHRETYRATYAKIVSRLKKEGISDEEAIAIADCWLTQGDFLLIGLDKDFDFVVGNPPYVRQELIPAPLLTEYRNRYHTIFDRADLYIPFIERSLSSLAPEGRLGFICSDRWMKNRYGGPLRNLIAEKFHLQIYVDMVGTPAFYSEVIAYPAITIINRRISKGTRIAHTPAIDRPTLNNLVTILRSETLPENNGLVQELSHVAEGSAPWLLKSFDKTVLVHRLERQFPSLEQVGCKVGIGVATGADDVFIGDFDALDVEADRKIPLIMTKDILSGEVQWQGQGVINPFTTGGGLVDLHDYPRLRRYLEAHRDTIAGRHCAKKNPSNWYRTIDRIHPALATKPKLLIPDIKGEAHVVLEKGKFYPHHNLYYVTSMNWDLRALQAVLLSDITHLFIETYSTRMHGGFLRFQAQYLRRIRLPYWADVSEMLRKELIEAASNRDIESCNRAAFKLYQLDPEDQSALRGNGE